MHRDPRYCESRSGAVADTTQNNKSIPLRDLARHLPNVECPRTLTPGGTGRVETSRERRARSHSADRPADGESETTSVGPIDTITTPSHQLRMDIPILRPHALASVPTDRERRSACDCHASHALDCDSRSERNDAQRHAPTGLRRVELPRASDDGSRPLDCRHASAAAVERPAAAHNPQPTPVATR